MVVALIAGFSLGSSLIIAIGAQNAFVLRQGLRHEHVLPIVLICSLSDAVLIAAGVGGFAAMTTRAPWLEPAFTYGGAAFLLWYGARSFRAASKGGEALQPSADRPVPLRSAMITCLALTWLNPHVYLDTLVVVGSVGAQYADKVAFAVGVTASSFVFFFCARLWRASARAGVRQPEKLAGARCFGWNGDVGYCVEAPLRLTTYEHPRKSVMRRALHHPQGLLIYASILRSGAPGLPKRFYFQPPKGIAARLQICYKPALRRNADTIRVRAICR
jgi:L-lysine exporter family protein LysE/ArgO